MYIMPLVPLDSCSRMFKGYLNAYTMRTKILLSTSLIIIIRFQIPTVTSRVVLEAIVLGIAVLSVRTATTLRTHFVIHVQINAQNVQHHPSVSSAHWDYMDLFVRVFVRARATPVRIPQNVQNAFLVVTDHIVRVIALLAVWIYCVAKTGGYVRRVAGTAISQEEMNVIIAQITV